MIHSYFCRPLDATIQTDPQELAVFIFRPIPPGKLILVHCTAEPSSHGASGTTIKPAPAKTPAKTTTHHPAIEPA